MKKVSILGSGQVAQALARGFIRYGYQVILGTSQPAKLKSELKADLAAVQTADFTEAAQAAPLLVLAVKGSAAEVIVREVKDNLNNKTVIDVTNPLADAAPENGVLKFFTTLDYSLMERLQEIAPQANFVKAFNSVGHNLMVNPDFGGIKPTMFICGDNKEAKVEVGKIIEQFGWEAEDLGGRQAARALEPLCILWCIPGLLRNDWSHAFKLLKK